ncbi:MAG: FumA C-terminus/TtdB family hydratase beta subunit [bacterium]|nr:FumA C-terminus/TtdB family hydratase beta subunit [bacterium]
MIKINLPTDEETIRALHIGDEVLLTGTIVTARDTAHKYMVTEKPNDLAPLLKDSVIYHCGPIVSHEGGKWSMVCAGPTTSIREEPFEAEVIKMYGVRGVIGKGGMGPKTLAACKEFGAVYFHTAGGCAASLAQTMEEVLDVKKLEFGTPEAFWVVRVKDFPCLVTMDSHGQSLHDMVEKKSRAVLEELIKS